MRRAPSALSTSIALVGLALAIGGVGCRRCGDGFAKGGDSTRAPADAALLAGDGGNSGDAADAAGRGTAPPAALRAVAIAPTHVWLLPLGDGRLLVRVGELLYEAKPDGALELLTPPSTMAPFLVSEHDLSGSTDVGSKGFSHVNAGDDGEIVVFDGYLDTATSYALADSALKRRKKGHSIEGAVPWRGGFLGHAYKTFEWVGRAGAVHPKRPAALVRTDSLLVTSDGTLIALGAVRDKTVSPERDPFASVPRGWPGSFVFPPSGLPTPKLVWIDPSLHDEAFLSNCYAATSFDGNAYAHCERSALDDDLSLYKYGDDRWSRIKTAAKFVASGGATAGYVTIAKDGTIVHETTGGALVRCASPEGQGSCTPVPEETLPEEARTPVARYVEGDQPPQYENKPYQTWVHVQDMREKFTQRPAGGDAGAAGTRLGAIVARTKDDVWVVRDYTSVSILFHTGPARPLLRLPGPADASVQLRNEQPPDRYVARCDHVFIVLDHPAPGVAIDPTRATALRKTATAELGRVGDSELDNWQWDALKLAGWELVTGRLHGERVLGLVVHHDDPEMKDNDFAAAVERLIAGVSRDPATPPTVTCTLPVLEAIVRSGP